MYLLSAVSYKILKEQQRVAGKLLKVSRCPVIQRHRNESFALGLFKGSTARLMRGYCLPSELVLPPLLAQSIKKSSTSRPTSQLIWTMPHWIACPNWFSVLSCWPLKVTSVVSAACFFLWALILIYNALSKLGHEVLVLQAEFSGDLSFHSRPSSGVSSSRLTCLSL